MYMNGPFLLPNQAGPVTVKGITYPAGTAAADITAGSGYQYGFDLREYWRRGLQWLQDYSKQIGNGNFETLSESVRTQILQDLWNNKPTNFQGPTPREFFSEVHDMTFAGFFTDPLYGGNKNMVGWQLIGFSGTNQGNAYKEGYSPQQLMVMDHPVRLQPQSLAQFQKG